MEVPGPVARARGRQWRWPAHGRNILWGRRDGPPVAVHPGVQLAGRRGGAHRGQWRGRRRQRVRPTSRGAAHGHGDIATRLEHLQQQTQIFLKYFQYHEKIILFVNKSDSGKKWEHILHQLNHETFDLSIWRRNIKKGFSLNWTYKAENNLNRLQKVATSKADYRVNLMIVCRLESLYLDTATRHIVCFASAWDKHNENINFHRLTQSRGWWISHLTPICIWFTFTLRLSTRRTLWTLCTERTASCFPISKGALFMRAIPNQAQLTEEENSHLRRTGSVLPRKLISRRSLWNF